MEFIKGTGHHEECSLCNPLPGVVLLYFNHIMEMSIFSRTYWTYWKLHTKSPATATPYSSTELDESGKNNEVPFPTRLTIQQCFKKSMRNAILKSLAIRSLIISFNGNGRTLGNVCFVQHELDLLPGQWMPFSKRWWFVQWFAAFSCLWISFLCSSMISNEKS